MSALVPLKQNDDAAKDADALGMLEAVWLEDLAKDQVYEFLFIASPLKMRGATASPIRPLAIAIQRK